MKEVQNVELTAGLSVYATDEPTHGGAHHAYQIVGDNTGGPDAGEVLGEINFQNGPVREHGLNGVSESVLLAIVIDRLQSFQKGDYSCRENALALTKLEEAVHWMDARTRNRQARGVEGTSAK